MSWNVKVSFKSCKSLSGNVFFDSVIIKSVRRNIKNEMKRNSELYRTYLSNYPGAYQIINMLIVIIVIIIIIIIFFSTGDERFCTFNSRTIFSKAFESFFQTYEGKIHQEYPFCCLK